MNSTLLASASANIPNHQILINMVRLRVRQLSAGSRPLMVVAPGLGLADVALSEIGAGKLISEPIVKADAALAASTAIINFPASPKRKKAA